jgi:hypothetical protein
MDAEPPGDLTIEPGAMHCGQNKPWSASRLEAEADHQDWGIWIERGRDSGQAAATAAAGATQRDLRIVQGRAMQRKPPGDFGRLPGGDHEEDPSRRAPFGRGARFDSHEC